MIISPNTLIFYAPSGSRTGNPDMACGLANLPCCGKSAGPEKLEPNRWDYKTRAREDRTRNDTRRQPNKTRAQQKENQGKASIEGETKTKKNTKSRDNRAPYEGKTIRDQMKAISSQEPRTPVHEARKQDKPAPESRKWTGLKSDGKQAAEALVEIRVVGYSQVWRRAGGKRKAEGRQRLWWQRVTAEVMWQQRTGDRQPGRPESSVIVLEGT
ncbi:hypothetical protein B0H19DRAFT_1063117 [Mycena capillaripes]|nr:hypothetical protein B0H19DRAFT_1063117 [Mycena capillaripes]